MSETVHGVPTCPNCEALEQKLVQRMEEYHALVARLASTERELRGVKQQRDRELERDPSSERVKAIMDHWLDRTWSGRGRKPGTPLSGERAAKVRAQLKHKHPDEITRAIDGYAAFPYVVEAKREAQGKPDDRFVDLELICRSEKKVEDGLKLADRRDRELKERREAKAREALKSHNPVEYPLALWTLLFALEEAGCPPKRQSDRKYQSPCPYCRSSQANIWSCPFGSALLHCPSCQEGNWVTEEVDQSGWADQLGLAAA